MTVNPKLGLGRDLWVVQAGIFVSHVGWGAVLPFEVLYLHEGRGFSLGVAGLVVGVLTGVAVVGAPLAGPLIDRVGARPAAVVALVGLAAGYLGLAGADTPPEAFAAAAAAGLGNGILQPSQSTLVVTLVAGTLRHRASAISRIASNVGFAFGGGIGGLVAAGGLGGYVVLLMLNAGTYLVYAVILVVGVRLAATDRAPMPGGYRLVLGDRAFVHLALTNVAVIAVGWGVFSWLVPAHVGGELGLGSSVIGSMAVANSITVVVAQVPIARLAEGRRRAVTMAIGALLFVPACLLVLAAGVLDSGSSRVALIGSSVLVGLGECFHTAVLVPLAADLSPAAIRGRYMAVIGVSWWLGLALAPTLGGQLLSISPSATIFGAAALAIAAAGSILRLERRLPPAARLTPRPADVDGDPSPRSAGSADMSP